MFAVIMIAVVIIITIDRRRIVPKYEHPANAVVFFDIGDCVVRCLLRTAWISLLVVGGDFGSVCIGARLSCHW